MTVCSSRNMVGVEEADRANQLPLRSERLLKIFYAFGYWISRRNPVGSSLKVSTAFVSQMYDLNTLHVYHTY